MTVNHSKVRCTYLTHQAYWRLLSLLFKCIAHRYMIDYLGSSLAVSYSPQWKCFVKLGFARAKFALLFDLISDCRSGYSHVSFPAFYPFICADQLPGALAGLQATPYGATFPCVQNPITNVAYINDKGHVSRRLIVWLLHVSSKHWLLLLFKFCP